MTNIIGQQAAQIDRTIPAILAAHVWVMNAKIGTEKSMSIGQEHMLLLGNVANPAFDYVALGHIHKGQVLQENPPVVYSGSLERVDFGDEGDAKGFYIIDIQQNLQTGQRQVKYTFHPVQARRFFSLRIEIKPDDLNPTATVLQNIEPKLAEIEDAVTRIEISLPAELSSQLRDDEIHRLAAGAYHLTITRDIHREVRLRLGKSNLEGVTPQEALRAYLTTKFSPERAKILQEEGEKLIQEYNNKC